MPRSASQHCFRRVVAMQGTRVRLFPVAWHAPEFSSTGRTGTRTNLTGKPTSMIGLCQEAKSPPDALGGAQV